MFVLRSFGEGREEFQFQYGAIKSLYPDGGYSRNFLFQFQYGAIKRYILKYMVLVLMGFQFQYGAIKSKYNK